MPEELMSDEELKLLQYGFCLKTLVQSMRQSNEKWSKIYRKIIESILEKSQCRL
jgi:hypothetical protein